MLELKRPLRCATGCKGACSGPSERPRARCLATERARRLRARTPALACLCDISPVQLGKSGTTMHARPMLERRRMAFYLSEMEYVQAKAKLAGARAMVSEG